MNEIPKRKKRERVKYTVFQRVLEVLCLLALVGIWVGVLVVYPTLPEQIPTHYNAAGVADAWGDPGSIFVVPITSIALYVLLTAVSFFPGIWNLPVSREELNRDTLQRVYSATLDMVLLLKLSVLLTFAYITCMTSMGDNLGSVFMPIFITADFVVIFGGIARVIWVSRKKSGRVSK